MRSRPAGGGRAFCVARAVDHDLQFIRIDGTVVGAIVGRLLFLAETLIR